MKRRGVEVMYRYRNNRDQPCPWACFPPNFLFISCIVIHNNMTLKSLVWWKNFVLFTLKIKKKILNWHWVVPAIQQHSVGLNDHWKVTEQCLKSGFQWAFHEHSVGIQKCFNWLKGEFSSCEIFRACINSEPAWKHWLDGDVPSRKINSEIPHSWWLASLYCLTPRRCVVLPDCNPRSVLWRVDLGVKSIYRFVRRRFDIWCRPWLFVPVVFETF